MATKATGIAECKECGSADPYWLPSMCNAGQAQDIRDLLKVAREILTENDTLDRTTHLLLLNTVNTALMLANQQRFSHHTATSQ